MLMAASQIIFQHHLTRRTPLQYPPFQGRVTYVRHLTSSATTSKWPCPTPVFRSRPTICTACQGHSSHQIQKSWPKYVSRVLMTPCGTCRHIVSSTGYNDVQVWSIYIVGRITYCTIFIFTFLRKLAYSYICYWTLPFQQITYFYFRNWLVLNR